MAGGKGLFLLLLVAPLLIAHAGQDEQEDGYNDINDAPQAAIEGDFDKRLKQDGEQGEDDAVQLVLLLVVEPSQQAEATHSHDAHEGVVAVGHIEQAEQQQQRKHYFERIHDGSVYG